MSISAPRYVSPTHRQSALLLAEMQEAHKRLLQAMAELDDLTRGPLPTKERIIDARWSISRASLARRMLWSRVFTHLSSRASTDDLRELSRLQEADRTLLRLSSAHVSRWNIDTIIPDWAAYCAASAAIRWKMKAAMGAEKRLIYPMLDAQHLSSNERRTPSQVAPQSSSSS